MTTLEYILGILLIAVIFMLAFKWSECRFLNEHLDQVRADRDAAYARNGELRAQHAKDLEASAARLIRITEQSRLTTNTSKEI